MNEMNTPPDEQHAPDSMILGRDNELQAIQQMAVDRIEARALAFTGERGIGRTALLHYAAAALDTNLLPVFVSFSEDAIDSEDMLLRRLTSRMSALMVQREFTLIRLPDIAERDEHDTPPLRQWFDHPYLDLASQIIRPHRRWVFLFDDVHLLLDGMQNGRFPPDMLIYFENLLQNHTQLSIVMTIPLMYEDRFGELSPLVEAGTVERLQRLSPSTSGALLQHLVPTLTMEQAERIVPETGGHPALLRRFASSLAQNWSDLSPDRISTVKRSVYNASEAEFHQQWQQLDQNERLVLTAMISLYYENTSRDITVSLVEQWLVDTDYPLDIITIQSALRSLEYRALIKRKDGALMFTTGLMQLWLLEHARLDPALVTRRDQPVSFRGIILLLAAAALVIVLLFAVIGDTLAPVENGDPVPTVTLSS